MSKVKTIGTMRVAPAGSEQDDHIIAQARAFAVKAHGGQLYGAQPYVVHLDAVADVARLFGMPAHVIAAAYLHDVVEDVPSVSVADIAQVFGPRTAAIVAAVSKPKTGYDLRTYILGIRDCGRDAVFVKIADRLCNARAGAGTRSPQFIRYRGEHALFKSLLAPLGPHPEIWAELDRLLGS